MSMPVFLLVLLIVGGLLSLLLLIVLFFRALFNDNFGILVRILFALGILLTGFMMPIYGLFIDKSKFIRVWTGFVVLCGIIIAVYAYMLGSDCKKLETPAEQEACLETIRDLGFAKEYKEELEKKTGVTLPAVKNKEDVVAPPPPAYYELTDPNDPNIFRGSVGDIEETPPAAAVPLTP